MKRLTPILILTILIILALTGCEEGGPEFYTISFETNGAVNEIESQLVKNGGKVIEPKDPVKDNASFKMWVRVKDDGTTETDVYDFSAAVTGNLTLKAVYNSIYTIAFNNNGGSYTPSVQYIAENGVVSEPKDPEKEHTYFKMWVKVGKDGTESTSAYSFSTPVTENFTLKAVYYTTYTVTFWSNEGASFIQNDVQYVKENGFATEPAPPEPSVEQWSFKEWATENEDGSYTAFNCTRTPITENTDIYATYWKKYSVTYLNPDGTTYKTEYVKEGTAAPLLAGPEKDGAWSFKKWVSEDGSGYDFTSPVNGNITLKPTYIEGYKVTFDSDGGDYTPSEQFIKENGKVMEPKNPDKASTRGFLWWTTEDGNPYDFSSSVTSTITLKAVYWPATMNTGGDSSFYDDKMKGIKNEVECMHYIIKKLVKNNELMTNKSTDFQTAFNTTSDYDDERTDGDALAFSILRNALLTPETVPVSDTIVYPEDLASYKIASGSIGTNTTEVFTNDINTKYVVNITGLKIKVMYNYDFNEYNEEADISIKGTFIENSDERYEIHIQMTVNGYEYPPLHAIATKSGDNGDDNVVIFNYKNFTSYCSGVSLW